MGNKAKSGIKGVTLVDLWQRHAKQKEGGPRSRRPELRWYVRVRDAIGRETGQAFADGQREQALAWGEKKRSEFVAGLETAEGADFQTYGKEQIENMRAAGLSRSHITTAERVVRLVTEAKIRDMKDHTFQMRMRAWLEGLTGLSAATRALYYRHIRCIVRFALDRGALMRDPLRGWKAPKVEKRLKEVFTLAEMRLLVDPKRSEDPYYLRACLIFYTGCRIGEALHLRWENIDFETGRVQVRLDPEYRIKGSKEREFPLQDELRSILLPRAKPSGYLVEYAPDRKTNGNRYNLQFRAYLERCGVKRRGRTPHSGRHCHIGLALATDVNAIEVMKWAGHADLQTTTGYAASSSSYRAAVAHWPKGQFRLLEAAPASIQMPTTGSKSAVG